MSVGPVLVMTLTDFDAVEKWKRVIGQHELLREEWFYPISMKKRFGLRAKIPDALHGSKTCSDAIKENIYFFPDSNTNLINTKHTLFVIKTVAFF